MFDWSATRAQARAIVHETFSLPATYTGTGEGALTIPILARLHTRIRVFGDLDREGFAQVMDDVTRVIVDGSAVVPARGGTLVFVTPAGTYTFRVEVVQPDVDGNGFIPLTVKKS